MLKTLYERVRLVYAFPMVALALSACSSDLIEVPTPESGSPQVTEVRPPRVRLVKFGPEGTTATFTISATGGTLLAGSTVTMDACPHELACPAVEIWAPTDGSLVEVTVTETSSTGNLIVERINVISDLDGTYNIWWPEEPTVTVHVDGVNSTTIRFKNVVGDTQQEPALRVIKYAESGSVTAGSNMTFNMVVYSDGPGTATNVTLTDALPGGVGISWTTTTAGCTIAGAPQTLVCSFGDMAAGTQQIVTVTSATSAENSCGDYTNTVSVSADNHATVTASAIIIVEGCTRDGLAGCTPGFWKQSQHFAYWTTPYTPSTLFSSVFADAFPGKTLLQVVGLGGGGLNALGRHTVAALLNAADADVDYGMTPSNVISAFNAAYASGDYEVLKNHLEARNERVCTAKDN